MVAFFEILAPVILIFVAALVVSQCLVPALLGTPWFPMSRREVGETEEAIQASELETILGIKQSLVKQANQKETQNELTQK